MTWYTHNRFDSFQPSEEKGRGETKDGPSLRVNPGPLIPRKETKNLYIPLPDLGSTLVDMVLEKILLQKPLFITFGGYSSLLLSDLSIPDCPSTSYPSSPPPPSHLPQRCPRRKSPVGPVRHQGVFLPLTYDPMVLLVFYLGNTVGLTRKHRSWSGPPRFSHV